MKKKSLNGEIDILEVFSIIWSGKSQILFINILFIFLGLIFYTTTKTVKPITNEIIYKTSIKIYPISVFEAFEFSSYNNYVNGKLSFFSVYGNSDLNQIYNNVYKIEYERMHAISLDRKSLYNYFIYQVKEKNFFRNELISFLNTYKQNQKYTDKDNIINEITQSIKIVPNINDTTLGFQQYSLEIEFKGIDVNSIKIFFNEYEKLINNNLKEMFVKKFNYSVTDSLLQIDNEIDFLNFILFKGDILSLEKKKEIISHLDYLKKQKQLENNNSIGVLENSPLISKNFIAARFDLSNLDIKELNVKKTYTIISIVLSSIFFGSIISILYVLFIHAYREKISK